MIPQVYFPPLSKREGIVSPYTGVVTDLKKGEERGGGGGGGWLMLIHPNSKEIDRKYKIVKFYIKPKHG